MRYPINDQSGLYADELKNFDDRGGELSDLIEEFDVKKDFDVNAYINSNIDY